MNPRRVRVGHDQAGPIGVVYVKISDVNVSAIGIGDQEVSVALPKQSTEFEVERSLECRRKLRRISELVDSADFDQIYA
jgi:hypothetical protein